MAAFSKLSVASRRTLFVGPRSAAVRGPPFGSAESASMTTSGLATRKSASTASASKASTTATFAPSFSSVFARSGLRVEPVTSCPRATSALTIGTPIAPLAPPTNTFISVDLRDVDFVRSPVDVSRSGAAKRRRRSRERGTSAAGRDAIAARRAAPHPIFSFGHGCSPLPDRALGMGASRNGGITVRSAGEERTL